MRPMADIPMPTLRTPPGVSMQSSHGMGGSLEDRVAYATAVTTLSAGSLLQSYAEQVQKAGWKAHPPTIGDPGALQGFEMTDSSGKTWRGLLCGRRQRRRPCRAISRSLGKHSFTVISRSEQGARRPVRSA